MFFFLKFPLSQQYFLLERNMFLFLLKKKIVSILRLIIYFKPIYITHSESLVLLAIVNFFLMLFQIKFNFLDSWADKWTEAFILMEQNMFTVKILFHNDVYQWEAISSFCMVKLTKNISKIFEISTIARNYEDFL